MKLTHEHLVARLDKLNAVLVEQGFPKGTVQIGFSPAALGETLLATSVEKDPIITPQFECHFEGGTLVCTF